ncbi:hypothetical protein JRQ81_001649, partial [Phrynocephalus forsythii]
EVVDTLGLEEGGKYKSMKVAALLTLNLMGETYRKCFGELRTKPGIPLHLLAQTMQANMVCWLKPEGRTKDQMVDDIVIEQLVRTVGIPAKNWVRKNWPMSVKSEPVDKAPPLDTSISM